MREWMTPSHRILQIVAALTVLSVTVGALARSEPTPSKPNIVLFIADDLGWGDPGFRGGEGVTPNLDRLAARSVALSRLYAHPACAPSRASIMTGRTLASMGIHGNLKEAGQLPLDEHLMPEAFRAGGYQTWLVGKWHLGGADNEAQLPHRRGFDHFYGFVGGSIDSFTHVNPRTNRIDWQRNGEPLHEDGYSTTLLQDEALRLLAARDPDRPFLLVVSFNAVHGPYRAPGHLKRKYRDVNDRPRRRYLAMLEAMDLAIGRVLNELDEIRDRDAVVLFLNDNGGPARAARNAPWRGAKRSVFEGGIRVGGLISRPGVLPEGKSLEQPCTVMDIFPTLAEAAGIDLPAELALDGTSIWSAVRSGTVIPRPGMTVGHKGRFAVFQDPYKLVVVDDLPPRLYDLKTDPLEATDIARQHPDLVRRLLQQVPAPPIDRSPEDTAGS